MKIKVNSRSVSQTEIDITSVITAMEENEFPKFKPMTLGNFVEVKGAPVGAPFGTAI